jgi:hypothetical protein
MSPARALAISFGVTFAVLTVVTVLGEMFMLPVGPIGWVRMVLANL